MQKTTLTFDESKSIFTTEIPVLVNNLNYGNHLGYESILTISQEARMRWLKENNMGEMAIAGNIGYLIKNVHVTYEAEAFHGDILNIDIYIADIKSRSFTIMYKIANISTNTVIALVSTGHIFYDFSLKKIARAPDCFKGLVESFIG